ncbi:MAG: ParB N-terminal domain-containing protein [Elusimicrobia bacterium]|nr:ParB N-terminal domain-containing protein [Elusimicrobiota bacterium]
MTKIKPVQDNQSAQNITDMKVDTLLLDQDNPRLASGSNAKTQEDLLQVLWNEMAVDEVALSIAANGFFREEPLFVVPDGKGKYIVVEGNRRLAAVTLLRDEAKKKKVGATDLPTLTTVQRAKLDTLPVSVYSRREELWQYFGFRHINGAKPWDAFSKAQYVAEVHEKYKIPLDKIANSIGDRHTTVKRLYRGYKILEQAESSASFNREDRVRNRFYFSHLYTAADQPEFQKFLGLDPNKSLEQNPVPKGKLPELKEMMIWLYGSKASGKEPIVRSQNPDLNLLREVVSRKNALAGLRTGLPLERAFEIGIGDKRRFRESLTRAKEDLQQAKATVTTGYSGEQDLYDTIKDILAYAETIKSEMDAKDGKKAGGH